MADRRGKATIPLPTGGLVVIYTRLGPSPRQLSHQTRKGIPFSINLAGRLKTNVIHIVYTPSPLIPRLTPSSLRYPILGH